MRARQYSIKWSLIVIFVYGWTIILVLLNDKIVKTCLEI